VLTVFIETTVASSHSCLGRLLRTVLLKRGSRVFDFTAIATAPVRDLATPVLLFAAIILRIVAWRKGNRSWQRKEEAVRTKHQRSLKGVQVSDCVFIDDGIGVADRRRVTEPLRTTM
jgi:hypothetical protein